MPPLQVTNGQLLRRIQILGTSRGKFECHWCSQQPCHATPHEAEQVRSSDTLFTLEFYRNILIPSVEGLSVESKIRSNNLRHSNTLPVYFRIYEDDLPALSRSIETQFLTSDHNTTYRYFFVYFKFGQMKTIVPPISMQSTNLDPRFSMFWSSNTISYFRGISTRKYPFLGLNELSNITSTFPAGVHLYQAIARRDRTVTRYTYSQAYTPLTKALDPSAFKNRPFLLALLLGKDYIKEQPALAHIYNSTAKLLEYQQGNCHETHSK